MARKIHGSESTVFDRFAVGLLSAILAALTAIIIQMLFFMFGAVGLWSDIYFYGAILFTGVMFIIGFTTNGNLLAEIYGKIWNLIYRFFFELKHINLK